MTLAKIVEITNSPCGGPVMKSILSICKISSLLAMLSISGCMSTPNRPSTSADPGPGSLNEKGEKTPVTNGFVPPYGVPYWYWHPR